MIIEEQQIANLFCISLLPYLLFGVLQAQDWNFNRRQRQKVAWKEAGSEQGKSYLLPSRVLVFFSPWSLSSKKDGHKIVHSIQTQRYLFIASSNGLYFSTQIWHAIKGSFALQQPYLENMSGWCCFQLGPTHCGGSLSLDLSVPLLKWCFPAASGTISSISPRRNQVLCSYWTSEVVASHRLMIFRDIWDLPLNQRAISPSSLANSSNELLSCRPYKNDRRRVHVIISICICSGIYLPSPTDMFYGIRELLGGREVGGSDSHLLN